MATRFVTYCRVSTDKQGRSGLGLEAQREAVERHLARVGGVEVAAFVEVESGKRADRPQLLQALATARAHGAVLIVAKLDRLARNVAFISTLMEAGVDFVACDCPAANRLTLHILAAMGEHEAAMISERTKAALAATKARGTILGGYRGGPAPTDTHRAKATTAKQAKATSRARDLAPLLASIRAEGHVTLPAMAQALNERGIPTARGCMWTPTAVQRVNRILFDG
jgi:DNA invertase Pin-like site-specific DNA recombinase